MNKVTESIYSGKSTVVPLADVQHIEKRELGLVVVTKHTRWDNDGDFWANSIWIDKSQADDFMQAWCRYRSELEADTLADLSPAANRASSLPSGVSVNRIKARIDTRMNDYLCEMKPDYDDSIVGFNEAWDIVRAILKEEIERVAAPSQTSGQ